MVDFAKLLQEKNCEGQKFDYLYRCTGCGSMSWRWFELPPTLTLHCASFPLLFGSPHCQGPMELVAMRRSER